MKNIAYSDDYLVYRQEQSRVFQEDYLCTEKRIALSPFYQLKKESYVGEVGHFTVRATENTLLDAAGKALYTYRNINDDSEFQKIISHADGKDYLLFRSDLYGYSVLKLDTFQEFHFIPAAVETFIWTDVFYNVQNNVLAVSGCFWACPCGTLLQDFSKPMQAPKGWVDLQEHLVDGYDRYDDVNFLQWQGTDLVVRAMDIETSKEQTISIPAAQYKEWLSPPLFIG